MTEQEKRENVIKGVECCAEAKCEVCPYEEQCFGEEICLCSPMAKDALAILKAHEPIAPTTETDENDEPYYACGGCGYMLGREMNFCPKCGRPVKWK